METSRSPRTQERSVIRKLANTRPALLTILACLSYNSFSASPYSDYHFTHSKGKLVTIATAPQGKIKAREHQGYLYQGDQILGKSNALKNRGIRWVHTNEGLNMPEVKVYPKAPVPIGLKWYRGVIPYKISDALNDGLRQAFHQAIDLWQQSANLHFTPWQGEKDYIEVTAGNQCASFVGRRGGAQPLILSPQCESEEVLHQIGHTLGLFHPVQRPDRDKYLDIHWQNLAPEHAHLFYKHNYPLPLSEYDYDSVMHYSTTYLGINDATTLRPLHSAKTDTIGQRDAPSAGDKHLLSIFYGAFNHEYLGNLTHKNDYQVQPYGHWFNHAGGALEASLSAQHADTDFELRLLKWENDHWKPVQSSENPGSFEHIRYNAEPGHYRFEVYPHPQSQALGDYQLSFSHSETGVRLE